MSALVVRGDALRLPLADDSVDLIISSPPYFALRSYRDGGEHYDGQIGSEPTPQAFLEALWAVTAECWRVLKPSGSMFVNLGDKRAGSGGHNNANLSRRHLQPMDGGKGRLAELGEWERDAEAHRATRRTAPDRYNQAAFGRPKSKMLLPHRYAIGCEDGHADPQGIGWIVRQDMVWWKPNGLPESVRDRTRDSHEYWFMLNKEERYYAAVDRIRQPHADRRDLAGATDRADYEWQRDESGLTRQWEPSGPRVYNPLGALPPSVWQIATEPLTVPDHIGVDHFAAFPSEWPRRLILGWSPAGICEACGQGRVPVVDKAFEILATRSDDSMAHRAGEPAARTRMYDQTMASSTTITGESCACPHPTAPTRPAVILDPFSGTGTVCAVARALGRHGIGVDLSADYNRLAHWRIFESGTASKARTRTNREAQGVML